MINTLWLPALSPAGGVLSVDNYVVTRNSSHRTIPAKKSIFAGWPLLLVQNLLSLVYLDAALCKLVTAGADWVNGYTLQYYVYKDASRRGSEFGLWLAPPHSKASGPSLGNHMWGR